MTVTVSFKKEFERKRVKYGIINISWKIMKEGKKNG